MENNKITSNELSCEIFGLGVEAFLDMGKKSYIKYIFYYDNFNFINLNKFLRIYLFFILTRFFIGGKIL